MRSMRFSWEETVAVAGAGLHDPDRAALAIRHARTPRFEQLADSRDVADLAHRLTPGVKKMMSKTRVSTDE